MTDEEYSLIVSFPDQSEAFTRGFEAGMIWEFLQSDATELSATYHTKNLEVISRMAKAMDYIVDTEETDDKEWTVFHFTKEKEIETKPKKFRPTVIQGGLK